MNYSTVYVGMDVHKETFSLCCYTNEKEIAEYPQKVEAHYSKVINYIEAMRFHYGDDVLFICGYEAGCLGFTLYHELTAHNVKCIILAPTTMLQQRGKKKVKTDKRDAALIARCLAHHDYSPVHVPTEKDEQVKEFIRMRDDHRLALKKVKQQILSFCLRHGLRYDGSKNHWTQTHINWLRSLKIDGLYQEILEEYLLSYDYLVSKIERIEQRIEELASEGEYREKVHKLECFLGIKTQTALSVITESTTRPIWGWCRARIQAEKIKTDSALRRPVTAMCGCCSWRQHRVMDEVRLGISQKNFLQGRQEIRQLSSNMQTKQMNVSGASTTE